MAIDFHSIIPVNDIDRARELVEHALREDKCKVNVLSAESMNAQRGSQFKLRTIGGMLVNMKVLPVRLQVTFRAEGKGGNVHVDAYDDLGFGLMVGMEEKYRQAVWDIMMVAVNAMDSVTLESAKAKPAAAPVATAPSAPAGSAFCTGCGKPVDATAKFCGNCGTAR